MRNAKMNWNDDSLRQQCAACNDVRTFALLSLSIDGGVLKHNANRSRSKNFDYTI